MGQPRLEAGGPAAVDEVLAAARAAPDPGVVGELGQAYGAAPTGRVVGRKHQVDRLDGQRQPGQVAVVGRWPVVPEDERDIGLPRPYRGPGLGWLGLDEGDLDARVVGRQQLEGGGRDGRRGGGERDQADPPATQVRERRQLLGRHVELAGDGVGPTEQHPAGLGERDAARAAHEQRAADLALQSLQLLADGRLGPAQLAGGRAERAGARDGPEDEHAPRVHGSKYGLWLGQGVRVFL